MPRIALVIFISLFTSTSALSASTTTVPTTAPATFWLDCASADLHSVLNAPSDNPLHYPINLAIHLVEARGDDSDRALLQQAMKIPIDPNDHAFSQLSRPFYVNVLLAPADALLNNPAAATKKLQEAEKVQLSPDEAHYEPVILATAWANIGSSDRAKEILFKLKPLSPTDDGISPLCVLAGICHDSRHLTARDEFFKEALARATAIVDAQYRSSALATIANRQSELRLFDAAATTTQSIPNDPERFEAYLQIADYCPRDQPAVAHNALLQAQTCAAKLTSSQLGGYERLAEATVRFDEPVILHDTLKDIDRLVLSQDTKKDELIDAPRIAAIARDRARIDQYLPFAEQAIQGYEGKENRADGWLRIAAAWASVEQRARCQDAIDQSMQIDKQRDYSSSPEYQLMLKAWITRGHPDIAMQLARRDFIPERHLYLDVLNAQISRFLCDTGQFDAAWQAADQITSSAFEFERLGCDSQIAYAMEKSGQRPLAVQKVDAISDPFCRATVNLDIAARWLGIYENWTNHLPPD